MAPMMVSATCCSSGMANMISLTLMKLTLSTQMYVWVSRSHVMMAMKTVSHSSCCPWMERPVRQVDSRVPVKLGRYLGS